MTGWGRFPDTVLHFETETPFSLDLRDPITAPALARLRSLGFEQSFGIVTAANPMGTALPADVNLGLTNRLKAEVEGLNATRVYVDACSRDASHCEASVAVGVSLTALVAMANRFDQLAVFWFDGDVFWIEPVRSTSSRLRLPAFP